MTEANDLIWETKLASRLHDPVEKALILMRTAEGHEGGTSQALRERLGLHSLPEVVAAAVRQADHWASAADRAAFPNRNADGRYPAWQNVRFHERPVIIHPLTGAELALDKLTDIDPGAAKALALDHFTKLIHEGDLQRTALAFWRFGPEIDADEIKSLWALLPADTRVPDHTIFDHLDLTAALATCFALDREQGPTLLAVSLGPVQEFIASARSTSDLWAGSHLLSRLAWEAMRVICEELGPEAILFPRLRGVPQVDVWLRDREEPALRLRAELFDGCEWTRGATDANPLFAAALPNRFTALVPANRARVLAERITTQVRDWILQRGEEAYRLLLETAGIPDGRTLPGYAQLREQLAGFPEVHWAAVPWSLVETRDGKVDAGQRTARRRDAAFLFQHAARVSRQRVLAPALRRHQVGGGMVLATQPRHALPGAARVAGARARRRQVGAPFRADRAARLARFAQWRGRVADHRPRPVGPAAGPAPRHALGPRGRKAADLGEKGRAPLGTECHQASLADSVRARAW